MTAPGDIEGDFDAPEAVPTDLTACESSPSTDIARDASGRVTSSEAAAALVAKRWAKPRPVRLDRRVRSFPAGSRIELRWLAKAHALDIVPDGMSVTSHRRLAYRLAADDTARRARRVVEPMPSHISDDDDLRLEYLKAESARLRARVIRDKRIALAHELIADQHEADLAALMLELGLIS